MGKDSLTKSTTKKKTAAKKKKDELKGAAKKTATPAPKPSLHDLVHRKFETVAPGSLYKPPVASSAAGAITAPPFYQAADAKDAERMRALMFQKHTLADLEAAAKARAEKESRIKAEAEARAKAEEQARIRAEAEAKAKAEEQARIKAEAEARAEAEEQARIKAEAEARAEAEEEARIKAEAEKLAAERAAARQAAAASEPQVSVTYGNGSGSASPQPVDKTGRWIVMGLAGGIALLFLLILGASFANTGKYYLKPTARGLEIWQGKFAPMGIRQVLVLPAVDPPEPLAPVYTRLEVMPLAVDYYLAEADAVLAKAAIPDFKLVQERLQTAMSYATSRDEREALKARMDGIDRAILIYKAQVGASRQTIDGYAEAIDNYRQALRLTNNEIEIKAIETRIASAEKARADLQARLAQEAAAAEAAAAEAKPAT